MKRRIKTKSKKSPKVKLSVDIILARKPRKKKEEGVLNEDTANLLKKVEKFKLGKKTAPMKLEYLEEGREFEIVGLEEYFRNLYIARISQGSILIRGDKRDNKDSDWHNLGIGYYIAPASIVRGL